MKYNNIIDAYNKNHINLSEIKRTDYFIINN